MYIKIFFFIYGTISHMKKRQNIIGYFAKNITVVIALVMIWRGMWYVLDAIDIALFGSYNHWTDC